MEAGQRIQVGGDMPRVNQSVDNNTSSPSISSPSFNRKPAFSSQGQGGQQKPQIKKTESSTTRLLDAVITMSLMAIFFGLPIFFTGMTLQGLAFEKEMYFYFWILLATVSWVSNGVMTGEMRIRKTPIDIPIAIFMIVYIASAAMSVDRWHSFWGAFGDPSRGVLSIVALVAAYYLILSHFTVKRMYLTLSALIASAFLIMIWSLLAAYGIHFLSSAMEQSSPLSPLGSITALTVFLGGMLPVFIAAISSVQSLANRGNSFKIAFTTLLVVGVVLDLFLLFAFFPYVSWVAVIGGFSFFLLYILARVVKMEERWTWLPMLVLVVLLAFYMIGGARIFKTNLPIEATPNMKLSWEIAKESMKNNLFLGSGPATYGYDFSLYRPQEYNQQPLSNLRFTQGTGIYFEAIPTIGLIGTIALTLLLLSFLSIGLYLLAQKKENDKFLSLGLWSAVVVFLIAALSTQINGSLFILGTVIAAFSLAVLMKESQSEESYLTLSFQSSPKFALALAFVFLVVSAGVAFTFAFIGKAFWSDTLAAKAMASPIGSSDGISRMEKASKYMPHESRYASYLGQIYLTMAGQEMKKDEKDRNIEALKSYIDQGNKSVRIARDMSPNDIVAQEVLAQTYENTLYAAGVQQGLLDGVQKAYEEALALEPHNPVYYMKLGQVKRSLANSAKGEEQKALLNASKDLFQKSIDEKSDFLPGYLNFGLSQEALGDNDAAIISLARGLSYDSKSGDADELKYNLARILRIRGKEDDLKIAEVLLKEIIVNNDTSLNAHLTLGLVYEQTDRKSEAIESYQRILSLLQGNDIETAQKEVQKLIDNVKAGKSNANDFISTDLPQQTSVEENTQSVAVPAPVVPQQVPATDAATTPVSPVVPPTPIQ